MESCKKFIKNHFKFIADCSWKIKILKLSRQNRLFFERNWINSCDQHTSVGYRILLFCHALEKGMLSDQPRRFGAEKVEFIIDSIELYEKKHWNKDFAFKYGISSIHAYCEYYEKRGWNKYPEYMKAKAFSSKHKNTCKSGVFNIPREEILKGKKTNYKEFLQSRHSARNFSQKILKKQDVMKAVEMAIMTPSACNRQMCKVYHITSDDAKNKVKKFPKGLSMFNVDTTNFIVVTYDVAAFCDPREINQGMFNAGLFSMNLVNALHSMGIGSCFLQFSNDYHGENKLKKILNTSKSERVAVIIGAGYYNELDDMTFPASLRRSTNEVYRCC